MRWLLIGPLFLATPLPAVAQPALEPTAISVGASSEAPLGDVVTLQARLVDSSGYPIAKADIEFVMPSRFLSVQDDAVVASAPTNQDGLAIATWQVRSSGPLTIKARFNGSRTYADSSASASLTVTGGGQLYTPSAGVHIPGLNEAPGWFPASVWPLPSAWPVVLVLAIVWSLYGAAAAQLFRIARGQRP